VISLNLTKSFASDFKFQDVSTDQWFYSSIEQAVNKGYVDGFPDGSFKPHKKVTHAEFLKLICAALKLPITDFFLDEARQTIIFVAHEIDTQLKAAGIRVEIDQSANRMQAKIRDAQNQKIPYMLVVGDREVLQNQVSVRTREGIDLGSMTPKEFVNRLSLDISRHSLEAGVEEKSY